MEINNLLKLVLTEGKKTFTNSGKEILWKVNYLHLVQKVYSEGQKSPAGSDHLTVARKRSAGSPQSGHEGNRCSQQWDSVVPLWTILEALQEPLIELWSTMSQSNPFSSFCPCMCPVNESFSTGVFGWVWPLHISSSPVNCSAAGDRNSGLAQLRDVIMTSLAEQLQYNRFGSEDDEHYR